LGPALARVAWHKAGAIAPGGTAVSARQHPRALGVLEQEAARQNGRLLVVGQEIGLRRGPNGRVEVRTERRLYPSLMPGLRGPHQAENLALALAAVERLWPEMGELPLELLQRATAA